MIFYVTVGGMKGTTWVQIVKAFLLMTGATILTVLVLSVRVQRQRRCSAPPPRQSGKGEAFLEPGCGTATRRPTTRQRSTASWT